MNWSNYTEVLAYIICLGRGHTLFKDPEQSKYNVVLTSREEEFKIPAKWVLHRTGDK